MITTRLYENENNDLVAVVFEDGQYLNYIPCPEIAAFEAESFLEEARLGFPDAILYEYDSVIGLTMEEAAAKEEKESILVAEVGEQITIYPQRMSQGNQEFFEMELGEEVWEDLLKRASDNEGVLLDL